MSIRGKIPGAKPMFDINYNKRENFMVNYMNMMELGAEIRRMRKEAGLRQDQLAGVSGVGIRFLVQLEHGSETAQIGKVFKVLKILGCEVILQKRQGIR